MFRDMRPRSRALIAATTLGLIAAPLGLAQTAQANPAGDGLVITEAYLNGGSAGATYSHKFVELYNPTSSPIDLTGKSVQYRSGAGTGNASSAVPLTGTVAAHDYYVLRGGFNGTEGANGVAVPNIDQTSSLQPSGSAGSIFLASGTSAINPVADAGSVIDLLGYGTTTASEGTSTTAASLTSSLQRQKAGDVENKDTDVNSADFAALAPSPGAGYVATPPPTDFTGTIAEIQGTGDTTPKNGAKVTTQGVVTASYPGGTGGFDGFYMQTPGANTADASDAIFVYAGGGSFTAPAVGDFVQVVGTAGEAFGVTQITPGATGSVTQLATAHDPVAPLTRLPASDCAVGACPTATELAAAREAHEGEVFDLDGPYTVSNSYSLTNGANGYAEIGLAADTKPLIAPTEVADAQTGNVAALTAYNNARGIVLDDGSSKNYTLAASGDALPWITKTHTVRVGAAATFTGPVVLDYRNSAWKLQPSVPVSGLGEDTVTFDQTRTGNAAPATVGGDIKLGTFNVLNYFPTTGQDYVANTPNRTCRYFADRETNPITVRDCDDTTTTGPNEANDANGPRGAARTEDFLRQQAKIVTAINLLGADVVSLEEIENSVQFGKDRDDAVSKLVTALNAAAGGSTDRWAFVPSPSAADLPALAEQDVIRTAFIYNPSTVAPVGASKVLVGEPAFGNAREPLAQAFKAKGTRNSAAFGVIVNHFKSKGSGADDGTGQGNANPDRVAQATKLADFADAFKSERGITKMFLTGDFNAYSEEDPIQLLEGRGYTNLESDTAGEESYSFSGQSGSLDHVFANTAALADVKGVDIWDINASEPIAYQYGRYNYNITDFFDGTLPFGASDHNPEIVGIDTPAPIDPTAPVDVQIVGTNDFHGRILNNTNNEAGAAVLSGAVKQFRGQNPNTVFAAAGDLIGASTFESFIQKDKPTIDALNAAGLEVSAAGNHEFDQGYDDLVNRVMKPYDATTNPFGGAKWQYIAANIRHKGGAQDGEHALPDTWTTTTEDGIKVGFVGAVTEDLPSLVSPDGIADIAVTDIVDEVNASAVKLKADGADVIVLLVHEGAANTSLAAATDPNSAFGQIVNGANADIDAIVSGHTHLSYNHSVPVPAWANRKVKERPVVSAGQYGSFLDKIVFTVDPVTGEVLAKTQETVALESCSAGTACGGAGQPAWTANFPADPAIKPITDDAVAKANVLGNQVLGQIAGPFNRAKINGTVNGQPALVENRGGESTAGNLVAEVQKWATEAPDKGGAQIAFMNPGGIRTDLVGSGTGAFPRDLTYRQAAEMQPFANGLVNMRLTGAQIKVILEQQWQRDDAGTVPSRPFLRLGTSKGFRSTYDPARPEGDRVTGMWLNGEPIASDTTYSVTANSFLAAGGDNFRGFRAGTQKSESGQSDLEAMVAYMAEFTGGSKPPLPVDYKQHQVGVKFPAGAPASYKAGDHVKFDLSSLAFSTAADLKDSEVTVSLGDDVLGTFPVDNTIGTAANRRVRHGLGRRRPAGRYAGWPGGADGQGCDDRHRGPGDGPGHRSTPRSRPRPTT